MGVPELLKFVAKAPNALTRVRQGGACHAFDYVLIDGTNVLQTVGVDAIVRLLRSDSINVREGVFIIFDSQRDRTGTSREQRSHLSSHAVDVNSQQLCLSLAEAMVQKNTQVFVSGREVEGEADFKLLHIQRGLTVAAKTQQKPIPKFLLVSEDSDVLSGALCGPAPGSSWIATRLRDATHELCLLSVDVVTAWLTGVGKAGILTATAPEEVAEQPAKEEEVVESRHKKDGPMVGMGTATYFADSDDEADDANANPKKASPASPINVSTATASQKDAARRQQSAAVDLILLFLLVKGSGYLSPIIKGATKVDMTSVWASYMQLGRSIVAFEKDSIRFDGAGLSKVLQSSHLFDSLSRPANEEEIQGARRYLMALSKTLLRCVVAFRGPRGSLDLVDGRSDQIIEAPSLAAFYALLMNYDTSVQFSSMFPPSPKPVANPIEESMMLLGSNATSRPVAAPRALPSIKVSVVQLLSSSCLADIVELFLECSIRDALSSTPETSASTQQSTSTMFSFDLRRMVAVDSSRKQASSAVLAAAGLSTGYSYAIDPAKVLARLRPNVKQPEKSEECIASPSASTPLEQSTNATVGVRASREEPTPKSEKQRNEPKAAKSRAPPSTAASSTEKGARKSKKRLGKKEREMLAKKMGRQTDKNNKDTSSV